MKKKIKKETKKKINETKKEMKKKMVWYLRLPHDKMQLDVHMK